jgi:hypothetical protein
MVMIATLTFLAFLCAILFLAGASYVSRGAVRRGVFIICAAIGLSAACIGSIYPALKLTDGIIGDDLRTAELNQIRVDRDRLATELKQKVRDNEAITKTSAFFTKLHKERLTRIAEELAIVKDLIQGSASGVTLASAGDASVTAFVGTENGYEAILADLRRLKSIRLRPEGDINRSTLTAFVPGLSTIPSGTTGAIVEPVMLRDTDPKAEIAPPKVDATETLSALKKALDGRMSTPNYRVELLAERELLNGQPGRYYSIELRQPKTGNRIAFESARYTLQGNAREEFNGAFQGFEADVLRQLEGHVTFDLFVRGTADQQSYTGAMEKGFEYSKAAYLPNTGRGQYLMAPAIIGLNSTVKNSDLPYLRGEFLRSVVAQLYPTKTVMALEGPMLKKVTSAARNTEIVLFVSW